MLRDNNFNDLSRDLGRSNLWAYGFKSRYRILYEMSQKILKKCIWLFKTFPKLSIKNKEIWTTACQQHSHNHLKDFESGNVQHTDEVDLLHGRIDEGLVTLLHDELEDPIVKASSDSGNRLSRLLDILTFGHPLRSDLDLWLAVGLHHGLRVDAQEVSDDLVALLLLVIRLALFLAAFLLEFLSKYLKFWSQECY